MYICMLHVCAYSACISVHRRSLACVRVTDTPDGLTHAQQWRTPSKRPECVFRRRVVPCAAVCAVCNKDKSL